MPVWSALKNPLLSVLAVVFAFAVMVLVNSLGSWLVPLLRIPPGGEPQLAWDLAWTILSAGADDFVTLSDDYAPRAMRLLAETKPAVVAGESGAAGHACLIALGEHPAAAKALGIRADSRVMLIGSEGATDPVLYEKLVGRKPESVGA